MKKLMAAAAVAAVADGALLAGANTSRAET